MALGPIHCGGFLLFAAAILLLVASISAPTVDDISFLNINIGRQKQTLGAFGYCNNVHASNHQCSSSQVGYDVTSVTGARLDHEWTNDTVNHLTNVLVLHPVAAGIAFFAFLVTLCADRLGFICAAFITFFAFVVSLVAMIFDFVVFGIVRHEINSNTTGSADYGSATWMTLAATIILFFAIFIVFFSCCTGMRNKKREYSNGYNNGGYVGNAGPEMGYATSRPWYSRFTNRNKY